MRIQHNIAAMNAYRNYNNNTSALSKNLEKLSSGYKINRAGDDAAGLAISEKMRAQITGLEAAQKNVKDGISLVKTAEGAMQEIQDMLNRMDYLATQSANGTYQDEVDREAIQKEVDQLRTEINRIADSANFNGIKLLDGSLDSSTTAVDSAQAAVDALSQPTKVDAVYGDPLSSSDIQGLMLPESTSNDPANATDGVGQGTILEVDGTDDITPSFRVSLNGVKYVVNNATENTAGTKELKLTIGNQNIALTEKDIADSTGKTDKGTEISSEELAQAFADKLNAGTGKITLSSVDFEVSVEGENLVFTATSTPSTTTNNHVTVTLSNSIDGAPVLAAGPTFTTGELTASTDTSTDHTATVTAKINGKDVTFTTGETAANSNAAAWATAIGNATATIDGETVKLSKFFDVSAGTDANSKPVLEFEDKTTGVEGSGNSISGVTFAKGATTGDTAASVAGSITKADGNAPYKTGVTGYSNFGTQDIKISDPGKEDMLASTTLDLSTLDITDGMKIKLGDTEYTFAVGENSAIDTEGENVIDLTDYEEEDLAAGQTDQAVAVSRLTDVADSNETFTVGHETNTAKLTLKQKAEAKDSTDMSTMENFTSYISISTLDTDATAKAQAEADAARAKDLAAAQEKLSAAKDKVGKPLTLQIGDTSESFNQMTVSVGDMHVSAMGTGKYTDENGNEVQVTKTIADIDVGNQEGAAEAINVIKNAINYVSSVRGDLGAIQNRLDHTANNLSVMAENIQDAESTIRDTDVAEEMMSYVKNNILVQSAQAMLAQANQLPQGVLQLLG